MAVEVTPYSAGNQGGPALAITITNGGRYLRRISRQIGTGPLEVLPGASALPVAGSALVIDWAPPLGVELTYWAHYTDHDPATYWQKTTHTIHTPQGWIHAPQDPTTALPFTIEATTADLPLLTAPSAHKAKIDTPTQTVKILGRPRPVILAGQQTRAQEIPITLAIPAQWWPAAKNLFETTNLLCIRTPKPTGLLEPVTWATAAWEITTLNHAGLIQAKTTLTIGAPPTLPPAVVHWTYTTVTNTHPQNPQRAHSPNNTTQLHLHRHNPRP